MRVAAAFINTTPLDWQGNSRQCSLALAMARGAGARLVLLPELCLSGYGCEDAFFSKNTRQRSLQSLEKILPQTEGLIAAVGLPFEHEGALYNVAALCVDGELSALIPKQNLALDGIHYEPRWFRAWEPGLRKKIKLLGREIFLGDWVLKAGEAQIGFEICHDAWVKKRPCESLKARGANIILCPSASHFALGKQVKRESLVHTGTAYVYSNLMGNEAGRAIYDGGAILAQKGEIVAKGARFSFAGAGLICADLELKASTLGEGTAELSLHKFAASPALVAAAAKNTFDENEEFTRAVALGLFDYLRKSKSKGFMLSLSGGADSAACAVLVDAMRRLATAELGEAEFKSRLGFAEPLLTCVYQATQNSSTVTREAARGLAAALKAPFFEFEIEALVSEYRSLAEKALGKKLSWDQDDLTLQNLQARVRSPGVWALANATGTLLIATNNRSEGAAGYTTMDGDTSGGLAPLAGIGKHFLRAWLKKYESVVPELKAVNAQEPTAELRPAAAQQTDENDLMPYEILDAIERLAARDGLSPAEVFENLSKIFHVHQSKTLGAWVIRYFQLFSRSQWKRERLAPSFHLDDHNIDPRSNLRFPILSGNYETELAELRASLGL